MDQDFPNVRRRVANRYRVLLAVLIVLSLFFLWRGGVQALNRNPKSVTYLEQAERLARENGTALSDEERATWEKLDANKARSDKSFSLLGSVLFLALGTGCGAGAALLWTRRDIRRTKLSKMAAEYTAHLLKEDVEGALRALNNDLEAPVYDSPQLTLGKGWLVGHVGATRVGVAFPLAAIAGVYYYFLVRRTSGKRSTTNRFYQILISDRFDRSYILQLGSKRQLDEVYPLVQAACPNADSGTYEEEYLLHYCALSKEERMERINDILRKNEADGMPYSES